MQPGASTTVRASEMRWRAAGNRVWVTWLRLKAIWMQRCNRSMSCIASVLVHRPFIEPILIVAQFNLMTQLLRRELQKISMKQSLPSRRRLFAFTEPPVTPGLVRWRVGLNNATQAKPPWKRLSSRLSRRALSPVTQPARREGNNICIATIRDGKHYSYA